MTDTDKIIEEIIRRVDQKIDQKFDQLDRRIDGLNNRIDHMETSMNERFKFIYWALGLQLAISLVVFSGLVNLAITRL